MIRTIIGSVLFASSFALAAELINLELSVLNLDKQPIDQAIIGQPFLLTVDYDLKSTSIVSPRIEGLGALNTLSSRISHTTIGKLVHVRCEYTLRADLLDTFTVGPIRIGGKTYDVCKTIQVKEAVARNIQQAQTQPFAHFVVSDSNPIVGQAVECTLTLYVPKQHSVEVIGMHIDDRSFMHHVKDIAPVQEQYGDCVFNGQACRFISWNFSFKPKHVAEFTIPSCSVDFSPVEKRSLFASFWGARAIKREFSNPVTITVTELEASCSPVHIIAASPLVNARLDANHVAAGDALEYAITVESKYPLATKDVFTLLGLPDGVRSYNSSPKVRSNGSKSILDIGFVLQCMKQGDVVIPEQVLRIYDTVKRDVIEIFLSEILLQVEPSLVDIEEIREPNTVSDDQVECAEKQSSVHPRISFEQQLLAQVLPVIAVRETTGKTTGAVVWFLVFCLLLSTITPSFVQELVWIRLRRFISLRIAVLCVFYARITGNPQYIWPVVLMFLRYQGVKGVISQETSVHYMYTQLGLDASVRKNFLRLWTDLVRARLYPHEYRDGVLYQTTLQWLREYRHVQ